jgi:hypothetical protein
VMCAAVKLSFVTRSIGGEVNVYVFCSEYVVLLHCCVIVVNGVICCI